MSDAQREMTLDEWMDALPDGHRARKEFDELRSRLATVKERLQSLLTGLHGDQLIMNEDEYIKATIRLLSDE